VVCFVGCGGGFFFLGKGGRLKKKVKGGFHKETNLKNLREGTRKGTSNSGKKKEKTRSSNLATSSLEKGGKLHPSTYPFKKENIKRKGGKELRRGSPKKNKGTHYKPFKKNKARKGKGEIANKNKRKV